MMDRRDDDQPDDETGPSPSVGGVGFGKFRYRLGEGPGGSAGDVEVSVRVTGEAGEVSAAWQVTREGISPEARRRIEVATLGDLRGYARSHRGVGLQATIVHAGEDPTRYNDHERAVRVALRDAMIELGWPVPPIYAL